MSRKSLIQDALRQKFWDDLVVPERLPEPGEFALHAGWSIRWEAPRSPLGDRAAQVFRDFCARKFGITLATCSDLAVCLKLNKTGEGNVESFRANVSATGIEIEAAHERGLLRGAFYIMRLMADRSAPYLAAGEFQRTPALSPRFSEGMFVPAMQTPENPGDFSDDYLSLMAYFGVNALKFYVNLFELWDSNTLPELRTEGFPDQLAHLRNFAVRLSEFGIDLYLHLNTPPLPDSHPVFAAHPEVKGAKVELFLEELTGKSWHALCSSNDLTLKAYSETLAVIFQLAPELAGVVMIVGGECFFHCFTRPEGPVESLTNCPHCAHLDPHREVAHIVNTLDAATRASNPDRRFFAWPYSAFIWSRQDPTQSDWIRYLNPGVNVLGNFDCFDLDTTTGGRVRLYDYNIKLIGPSSVFAAQRDTCLERGLDIFVKTETNTTPDTFFLPYLPVYFRWYARYKAIRESGAKGFMGQWRFYGMNGSIPEELQFHSVWNPDLTVEEILRSITRRDFALDHDKAALALAGWKMLSDAWDDFPWSAMTAGEREGYMRGAWYMGPAHPLIFNVQSTYKLGRKFFLLRGDINELASEDEVASMPKKPRYISDLMTCLPFGSEEYLELLAHCRQRWSEGVNLLRQAFDPHTNREAQRELGICQIISTHLRSLENTLRFYTVRDSLSAIPQERSSFEAAFQRLKEIAADEIENARQCLPILEADPRIGYGHSYGEVYDADLVREKIRQCEYVLTNELPRMESFIRFHIWQSYP